MKIISLITVVLISAGTLFAEGEKKLSREEIRSQLQNLSPEEREEFDCDVRKINWENYLMTYANGLQIYCLGQDQVSSLHGLTQLLAKNKQLGDDIKESIKFRKNLIDNYSKFDASIINENRFNEYIKMILNEKGKTLSNEEKFALMQKVNYRFDQAKIRDVLYGL